MDGFEIFFTMLALIAVVGYFWTKSKKYQDWLEKDV